MRRRPAFPPSLLLLAVIGLAACGEGGGENSPAADAARPPADDASEGPSPDAEATEPDAAPPPADAAMVADAMIEGTRVTAAIGPAGGLVEHPTGARLEVPPGAVGVETTFSVEDIAAPAAVAGRTPSGRAFRLGPGGAGFAAPVFVTLPLSGLEPAVGFFIAADGSESFAALPATINDSGLGLTAQTLHFSVVVAASPPGTLLVTSGPFLPPAVVGQPYGPVMLEATGGTPPLTWALVAGSPPAGLLLTADGRLEGTPMDTAGEHLQVRVTDAVGDAVEASLVLRVTREPLPSLTALAPPSAAAGTGPLVLRALGADFAPGDLVRWAGASLPTAFVDAGTLETMLPADLLATPGARAVEVERPGVGVTAPLTFDVVGAAPGPVLTSLEPDTLAVGAGDTQIRLLGGGFTAQSVARADAVELATGFVAEGELTAVVPAALLAAAGVIAIDVRDAAGTSAPLSLTVGAPPANGPVVEGLSFTRIFTGAGDTRIVLSGQRFDPAGTATLDGMPIPTEFFFDRSAAATLPGAVLAEAGPHEVRFENPAGAGGPSAPVVVESVPLPFGGVRVLAGGLGGGAYGVAADADAAYWVDWNTGDVRRVPLAGGAESEVLAAGRPRPFAVAVDAASVYWVEEAFGLGQGSLVRVPLAGGEPVLLAGGLSGPHRVELSATHAWVTEQWAGRLIRVPLAGGPLEVVAEGVGDITGLAVDDVSVYFASDRERAGLLRLAADAAPGTEPESLAPRATAFDIALGAEDVVWANQIDRQVLGMAKAGGPVRVLARDLSAVHYVAVHGGHVFYGDRGGPGLFVLPAGGDAPVLVMAGSAPWDLASGPSGLVVSVNDAVLFLPDAP